MLLKKKSEQYFKEYLENITNDQLTQFYDDIEWTPFPVLVINEYQNRFNTKNKKEVIEKLKVHTELAKEKTKELHSIAKNQHSTISKKIKNKGKKLATSIENTKQLTSSKKNIEILEKLNELNKQGIITNKEFQEKKKEILRRI